MAKRYFTKPRNNFTDAVLLNADTYFDYLIRLKRIATSMFEWVNLPPSMDARFLEMCLYYTGKASLLKDDTFGFINTKAVSAGYLNIYGLPTKLNCFSYEYHEYRDVYSGLENVEEVDPSKLAVLVKNNNDLQPTCGSIELFAYRLARAERTADVNIFTSRNPYLILTDTKQVNTMKAVFTQYDENTPLIYGDKNILDLDNIKLMKLNSELIVKDIKDYQKAIWNEALTFLGVKNLDEKRERMITDESDSNNELINLNLQSYLAPRKLACEQFNALFPDQKIDVKLRSDLHNVIKQMESVIADYDKIKEGENDG